MSGVGKTFEATELLSSTLANDPQLKHLVESFARELPRRFAAIEQALEQGDGTRVRRLVHQLKGTAASFGFGAISELAAAFERQDCDLERLRDILRRVAASMRTGDEAAGHIP